jgi:hypothetical protein
MPFEESSLYFQNVTTLTERSTSTRPSRSEGLSHFSEFPTAPVFTEWIRLQVGGGVPHGWAFLAIADPGNGDSDEARRWLPKLHKRTLRASQKASYFVNIGPVLLFPASRRYWKYMHWWDRVAPGIASWGVLHAGSLNLCTNSRIRSIIAFWFMVSLLGGCRAKADLVPCGRCRCSMIDCSAERTATCPDLGWQSPIRDWRHR